MSGADTYALQLRETNPLREPTLRDIVRHLDLSPGSYGLDVGCGLGLQTLLLAEAVGPLGHVKGVDVNADFVRLAERTAADAGLAERADFCQGDMHRLPFDSGAFDWLWSADCAGYAPEADPPALIRELARVVKRGGTVTILAWTHQQLLPGYPELEARLNTTTGGIAPFFAGMHPDRHFQCGLGWFRAAGLNDSRSVAFTGSVRAPLTDDLKTALMSIIGMRWPDAQSELPSDEWALFRRLTDPASADFILNRSGYFGFFTYTVHTGRVE